jgi:hypothetical protein
MTYENTHIHFCIPCYAGQMCEATFTSFVKFTLIARERGLNWSLDTMVNESLITRGRNNLAAKMLYNSGATHLMFIDSDIRFDPEGIFKLIDADKDLVAGLYPVKGYPIRYVVNGMPEPVMEGNLEEVRHIGTGFMMIKRTVLEQMIVKFPEKKFRDSIGVGKQFEPFMYALFETSLDANGDYMSEDWYFCDVWRAMGGKVFAHKEIILNHTGFHEFRGDMGVLNK